MRKNLWRGCSKEYNCFVYGTYLHQTEYYGDKCDEHYIVDGDLFNCCDGYCEHYEVYPETLSQYTGITDKIRTKIFENDYVLFGCKDNMKKWQVRWSDSYLRWQLHEVETGTFIGLCRDYSNYIEVID